LSVNSSGRSGLWLGKKTDLFWSSLIGLLLVMGSVRGALVIHFDLPPIFVYRVFALLLIIMAIYGFMIKGRYKSQDLIILRNFMKLNIFLGLVYVIVDTIFGMLLPSIALLYLFLAPYIVFLFLRVPTNYLNIAIVIITLAISFSVIGNFIDTLSGQDGIQKVIDFNKKLRPDFFVGLSSTGEFVRVPGYTGSYHDSANILGMAVSFFLIKFLVRKKIYDLGLFLFAMLGLTLTQSAANIVVVIATILIFSSYILVKRKKVSTYLYLVFAMISIILLISWSGGVMGIFIQRVGGDGDWGGMLAHLDLGSFISNIPYFIFGHATALGSDMINTEIGIIRIALELGIVHVAIFFVTLLFPLFQFLKSKNVCYEALPSLAAIACGFLSLSHYGSLLRGTSIFLFYAFYALCLVNIYKVDGWAYYKKRKRAVLNIE
jgi:hypothetical protein